MKTFTKLALIALMSILFTFNLVSVVNGDPDSWCTSSGTAARWTSSSAEITDTSDSGDSYRANNYCVYVIDPDERPIRVQFERFELEDEGLDDNDDEMFFDYLQVNSDGEARRYGGSEIPCDFLHTSDDPLILIFVSDGADQFEGWALNYTTDDDSLDRTSGCQDGRDVTGQTCNGVTVVEGDSGTITDGSAEGENYSSNVACAWIIGRDADDVNVTLTRLDVQSSGDCMSDSLSVWDLDDDDNLDPIDDAPERICGMDDTITSDPSTSIPVTWTNDGPVLVAFKSDGFSEGDGWEIEWTANGDRPSPTPRPSPSPQDDRPPSPSGASSRYSAVTTVAVLVSTLAMLLFA